ncbi:predicted protein [Sclerotinia sclerotiorum 1980 UF-70]|uniref:Uncharacterized protein n=1 Tax=Sclerotinia sclerotiorum (strain ATCC 18683 / 1980 / Ss-1) TaxID=665079 RepID=A7ESQ8_SCLS1|nr:predicted protein [Sclerotinia sclerotiorum 1980 UF-70]EDN92500.1 predicted protein [Sclerotinia sclerotiorum 1980 UF-70]
MPRLLTDILSEIALKKQYTYHAPSKHDFGKPQALYFLPHKLQNTPFPSTHQIPRAALLLVWSAYLPIVVNMG